MELTQNINDATRTRGEKRREHISHTAKKFYNFLKNGNYETFNKSLFTSFIPSEINSRTKQRLTKDVFSILEHSGKITAFTQDKNYVGLRNKPLSSFDYGSYSTLMKKNGYKMAYYIYTYDADTKTPKRVKVGSSEIGKTVKFGYDFAEPVSRKGRNSQGVISNSKFSVVKHHYKRKVKMFRVE